MWTAKTLIRLGGCLCDLSLRWEHMPFCWFCLEAAHIIWIKFWRQVMSYYFHPCEICTQKKSWSGSNSTEFCNMNTVFHWLLKWSYHLGTYYLYRVAYSRNLNLTLITHLPIHGSCNQYLRVCTHRTDVEHKSLVTLTGRVEQLTLLTTCLGDVPDQEVATANSFIMIIHCSHALILFKFVCLSYPIHTVPGQAS